MAESRNQYAAALEMWSGTHSIYEELLKIAALKPRTSATILQFRREVKDADPIPNS